MSGLSSQDLNNKVPFGRLLLGILNVCISAE
jgi:hypothetical protein